MFHLPYTIPPNPDQISHSDQIILLGSCFADSIGDKLISNKFQALSNPFGTIYSPQAIFKILSGNIDSNSITENQGVWYHWDTHGAVSALSQEELKSTVTGTQQALQENLKKTKWLIITFGSAYAYRLVFGGQLVANCHKAPSSQFDKELLTSKAIQEEFENMYHLIKKLNPDLRVILTVSPVRHVKDGLAENNRSKGRLLEATHSIVEKFDSCSYFPAYEIQLDELRDYRFYAKDKLHPSQEAIDYIWAKFSKTYFDNHTTSFLEKWANISSAIAHRPFHPETNQHQTFLQKAIDELRSLEDIVDISAELSLLQSQLNK